MDKVTESKCIQLIELLSCGDAEPNDINEIVPILNLALTNPKGYLQKFPDDAWLAEGFDLEKPDSKLSENIFSWSLSPALVDFVVVGSNPTHLYDEVMEVLYDMEIEIPETKFEMESWAEYAEFLEQQLLKNKTAKKLITFDINFSEDLSVFVVGRETYDQLLSLATFFKLKVVK